MAGHYNTFVVKIWRNEEATRGHVQHVQTKEYTYFMNLEKMVHFIMSRLGSPEDYSEILNGNKKQGRWPPLGETYGDINSDEAMFPE